MKVTVTSSLEKLSSSSRNAIQLLTSNALARFTPRIAHVSVTIVDENGPKGGIDKLCRVNVLMPGLGTVTTSARHEKLMAAVSDAARRARRIVVTKLKRPNALRLRQRKKGNSVVDETSVELM